MKKDLLEKIEKQGGFRPPYNRDILVSVEDFFEDNNVIVGLIENSR
ncbi:hypothetical protein [Clostridium sp. OS1-26]|nr:hypothetical protein [Clostridium sp. OS1-26]WML33322.1 hypothetical protein RCG18_18475 [Clostridium sp. OS1-26]